MLLIILLNVRLKWFGTIIFIANQKVINIVQFSYYGKNKEQGKNEVFHEKLKSITNIIWE